MSHETNATSPHREAEGPPGRCESALRVLNLLGASRLVFVTEEMPASLYAITGALLNASTEEEFRRTQLEAAIEYGRVSTEHKRELLRRVSSVLPPEQLVELGRLLDTADPPTTSATDATNWPSAPSAPTATSHHDDHRTTAKRALGLAWQSVRKGLLGGTIGLAALPLFSAIGSLTPFLVHLAETLPPELRVRLQGALQAHLASLLAFEQRPPSARP